MRLTDEKIDSHLKALVEDDTGPEPEVRIACGALLGEALRTMRGIEDALNRLVKKA